VFPAARGSQVLELFPQALSHFNNATRHTFDAFFPANITENDVNMSTIYQTFKSQYLCKEIALGILVTGTIKYF